MRSAIVILVLAAGAGLLCGRRVFTGAADAAAEIGRYQTTLTGSRVWIQRRGFGYRVDTKTGKAWHVAVLYDGTSDGWTEILETEGSTPEPGPTAGRYQIAADLVSDRTGQEAASAVRIDTVTGKSWFVQAISTPLRWIPLKDAARVGDR